MGYCQTGYTITDIIYFNFTVYFTYINMFSIKIIFFSINGGPMPPIIPLIGNDETKLLI